MSESAQLEEALANCSREPIHTPGTIQSFGVLIATDSKLENIEFVSQNIKEMLGVEPAKLLGASIETLLDSGLSHQARNSLSHRSIEEQREVVGDQIFADKPFQISVHLRDNRAILELLPINELGIGEPGALQRARALLTDSVALKDFKTVLDVSVENLRAITGYDRVKAYRFLPDGSGEVVGEAKASHVDSFLGLRFPASDIPPIARKLYATTPIRVLSNVDAVDIPILAADQHSRALDLSLAVLRGTADVHVRYIKNMDVKSTMTLPIIVDGSMWGMFSMHHMQPRIPDSTMLIAAELSGRMLSLVVQHTAQTRRHSHISNCTTIASEFYKTEDNRLTNSTYWDTHHQRLVEAIPSEGVAYIVGNKIDKGGQTPRNETCLAIRDLGITAGAAIHTLNDLAQQLPEHELGSTAGVMIIQLSNSPPTCFLLFRNSAMSTVNWAGAPKKEIYKGSNGYELSPRNSFSKYRETVSGQSNEWTSDDVEVAGVLKDALLRELDFQKERRDSQHRLKLLIQELNHRVRNILTLVQSLSSNSKLSATSLEGYAVALERRIVSLAGAHDLLTREDMRGVELAKIVSLELSPYMEQDSKVARVSGPIIILTPDVSPIIALVVHELTSNAVKYGALSRVGGSVEVQWSRSNNGLEIEWQECGGPPVLPPEQTGFGSSIIESAIPYEFGGSAKIFYKKSGVQAKFTLPHSVFETIDQESDRVAGAIPATTRAVKEASDFRCVLIVEDNYIIAKQVIKWFQDFGFQETDAVASVEEALSCLENKKYAFCLLDVDLRGTMSEPVADRLTELQIPYIFSSGYGSEGAEICDQYDVPFLTKPTDVESLRDLMNQLGVSV